MRKAGLSFYSCLKISFAEERLRCQLVSKDYYFKNAFKLLKFDGYLVRDWMMIP